MFRLDYISCVLTVSSAILLGQKRWQGWVIAGINSILICDIAVKTSQTGFIPANVFCVALYAYNILGWRKQIKTHRGVHRFSSGIDAGATTTHFDFRIHSATILPNNPRVPMPRPTGAELRLQTYCCPRSTPPPLDPNEPFPSEHPDLQNLLSCPINSQGAGRSRN